MFEPLPNDLQSIVFEYLPLDDIYKLEDAYDIKCKYFDKMMIRRVNERLESLGFDNEFNLALLQSNAFVSGSFILQSLLGETWPDSDIDIYQFSTMYLYKNEFPREYISIKTSPIERYLYNKLPPNPADPAGIRPGFDRGNEEITIHMGESGRIVTIRTYTINGTKVQVINVNTEPYSAVKASRVYHIVNKMEEYRGVECEALVSLRKRANDLLDCINRVGNVDLLYGFIKSNFDFEFLLNYFDSDKLIIADRVFIRDKCSANKNITPKSYMRIDGEDAYTALVHYRILKYIHRGFRITNYTKDNVIRVLFHEWNMHGDIYFDENDSRYYDKLLKYSDKFEFYSAEDQVRKDITRLEYETNFKIFQQPNM